MEPEVSLLPLAAVSVPIVTAVLIGFARRVPALRDAVLVVGAVTTFGCVAALVPRVLAGAVPTTPLGELVPGVELALRADGMGMVFAALASFLWILAAFYAIGYLRGEGSPNQTRFAAFYSLCLSTAFGVAFAADLFTFFVFYELLTISTYPLVTHKGDAKAIGAGRTYLGFLLSGGAAVLFGLLLVFSATGEVGFVAGGFVGDSLGTAGTITVFVLFTLGFGTKAGLMPLHRWLPSAMVAPTPVSALLHAVAVVKAGVFAFGRLVGFVLGPEVLAGIGLDTVLASVAAVTVVVASVVALRQDHLKRRLAYSTIAHLALIVLGFSLLTAEAFEGSLLHIVNHGLLKITLFFCAGAIHIAAHKDHVSELDGIGRRMPFTMVAFALAAYGLAALPPMGGFVSKWYLVLGAIEAGEHLFAGIIVFSGIFTAGYLFPIVYRAFFRSPTTTQRRVVPPTDATTSGGPGTNVIPAGASATPAGPGPTTPEAAPSASVLTMAPAGPAEVEHGEAPATMVVPLCITAAVALLLGLGDPTGLYAVAEAVGAAVTGAAP
jgi:multicomponent Na+:H+ antiporter subunit D